MSDKNKRQGTSDEKQAKLLNCPFCGGEAELMKGLCELDNYVMCLDCRGKTKFYNTKESAIKAWNTRKPMERIVEQLEEEHAKEMIFGFNNINDPFAKACSDNEACAYAKAIEIVKGEKDVDNNIT